MELHRCSESNAHGDDCFSVFLTGTDTCIAPHITFEQAYYQVYGQWPSEEE